jgi:hypothetical protein
MNVLSRFFSFLSRFLLLTSFTRRFGTELSGRRRYLSRHSRGHKSKRSKGPTSDRRTLDKEVIEEMKDAGWF